MPTSPRMGWPVPAEEQDPYYETFSAMVAAQDASVFATREDRNVLMMAGGTFTFNGTSGLLSWDTAIEINSAVSGFLWSIPSGSIVVAEGEYIFTKLVRNPTQNTTLDIETGARLPTNDPDRPLVIGLRRGNRIYFRGNKVLLNGQSIKIFEEMAAGGSGIGTSGQILRSMIPLATNEATDTTTPIVVGTASVDADTYTFAGTTKTFALHVIGNVTGAGVSGTVQLYNLSLAAPAATVNFTGSDLGPTKKTVSATIGTTEHIYELRIFLTGGTGSMVVQSAMLVVDNEVI